MALSHDVKRAVADSKTVSGLAHVLSTQGTTGLMILENDPALHKSAFDHMAQQFPDEPTNAKPVSRRSFTGANCYHLRASVAGLSVVVPFESGKLLMSPFHEIVVFDFEPKAGRREFIISVLGGAGATPTK